MFVFHQHFDEVVTDEKILLFLLLLQHNAKEGKLCLFFLRVGLRSVGKNFLPVVSVVPIHHLTSYASTILHSRFSRVFFSLCFLPQDRIEHIRKNISGSRMLPLKNPVLFVLSALFFFPTRHECHWLNAHNADCLSGHWTHPGWVKVLSHRTKTKVCRHSDGYQWE